LTFALPRLRELIARVTTGGSRSSPAVSPARTDHPASESREGCPLVQRLRAGNVPDPDFDDIYPTEIRALSAMFWTPVSIARRATELLVDSHSARVLDVGSGVGKFCVVGAAVTGAAFVGVEHRARLVQVARTSAHHLGVAGASFLHGPFDGLDITTFDAVYLFNPFDESPGGDETRIDNTVDLSPVRLLADITRAETFLGRACAGTRVVTYCGFGGYMPTTYRHVLRERCHTGGRLDLWEKRAGPKRLPAAAHHE
jgi:SAM-dependent methyltransferase